LKSGPLNLLENSGTVEVCGPVIIIPITIITVFGDDDDNDYVVVVVVGHLDAL
jgi:hypothetical protein